MDTADKDHTALRERLSPEAYRVTQEAATESPFTGQFWDFFEAGQYHCVVCGSELFTSKDKFASSCGWPSFAEVAAEGRLETHEDRSHGMHRIEVRCANCHAHLGHVFPDGPGPKGLRYCINSVALGFESGSDENGEKGRG